MIDFLLFLQNTLTVLMPDLKNTLTFLQNLFMVSPPFSSLSKRCHPRKEFESRSFFKSRTNPSLKRVPSIRFGNILTILWNTLRYCVHRISHTRYSLPGFYLRFPFQAICPRCIFWMDIPIC